MARNSDSMRPGARLRCIIIGAGVSGILIAYKLQEAFGDSIEIKIFEKNHDVGGTWLENRYPGCSCDVPSHIYQFSFCPNPHWSKFYASSAEIQSYLKAVTVHYQLERFITFESLVEKAEWNASRSRWTVKVGGTEHQSEILINASGILNNPKFPDLKRLEAFQGELTHTAAWNPRIEVTGKRVAIVGAGASAIQMLPVLQSQACHIDIYIRTPSWITPPAGVNFSNEHNHTYTTEEKTKFAEDHQYSLRERKGMESSFNAMYGAFLKNSEKQEELRSRLENRMKQLIHSEDLQKKLIPSFEAGCRRLNPGEKYLEALQQHNVETIFDAIDTVTSNGVQDESGKHRPVDVIIAATGFDTSFRPRFPIIGSDDKDLRELWKDDPASYCGLAVSGFPNYLIFLGPNTPISNGSLMGALEGTADYFIRLIRKMRRQRAVSFNVRQSVQTDFNDHTQRVMQKLVWTGSCRSWFKNSRGRMTAVWPGSGLHYREFLQSDRWEDFEWNYDGNQFDYWDLGYSQVERQADPDLSYYITQHPNLPLEALQRVQQTQASSSAEQIELPAYKAGEENMKSVMTESLEIEENDNSVEESATSGSWNDSNSDYSEGKAPQSNFVSDATALGVLGR